MASGKKPAMLDNGYGFLFDINRIKDIFIGDDNFRTEKGFCEALGRKCEEPETVRCFSCKIVISTPSPVEGEPRDGDLVNMAEGNRRFKARLMNGLEIDIHNVIMKTIIGP